MEHLIQKTPIIAEDDIKVGISITMHEDDVYEVNDSGMLRFTVEDLPLPVYVCGGPYLLPCFLAKEGHTEDAGTRFDCVIPKGTKYHLTKDPYIVYSEHVIIKGLR